ncbi:MAG: hypothetical protein HFJ26_00445 [Clostridia bacterium]|nr:hypothetical protein [Clostridia bacterium]
MKTIAFIVPYFTLNQRKLPEVFELWLNSCKFNETVDWFFITDIDISTYDIPKNVHAIRKSFNEIKEKIQSNFNFKISLDKPYKLCDFRPVYGEIFEDILKGYDYWGFCDIDVIWGDIRKFLTDKVLIKHDRILTRGNCSIFLNSKENNLRYRTLDKKGCLDYNYVFSHKDSFAFDEWAGHNGGGFSQIMKLNNIPMFDKFIFADIQVDRYALRTTREFDKDYIGEQNEKKTIFVFERGTLKSYSLKENEICSHEFMHLHLQRRPLKIGKNIDKNKFVIVSPNKVKNYDFINRKSLKRMTTGFIYWENLKGQTKWFIKNIILKRGK